MALHKRNLLSVMALAIAVADAPPTEFRIFTAGVNTSTKGTCVFDEQAARDVMASYQQHGVDVMIDLEHLSAESPANSVNYDPDARGWCNLEVRNGELWATNVTWTADGQARLVEKRQRYISPLFLRNKESGRVKEILNVAIVAMPATNEIEPLVAASRDLRKLSTGVAFDDVTRAISEALCERYPHNDANPMADPWVCDVFDATVVYQYDGKLWEVAYSFNAAVATLGTTPILVKRIYAPIAASRRVKLSQGDTPMTPEQFAALAESLGLGPDANIEDVIATVSAMVKKVQDAANGTAPADDTAAAASDAPKDGEPPAMVAAKRLSTAVRKLARLAGKGEIVAALSEVEAWRKSHVELEEQRATIAQERATLEGGERRRLVGELVKLGNEAPATAWADDTATKPAEPWASMPIESLRSRVAKLSGGKPPTRTGPVPAPGAASAGGKAVEVNGEVVQLSRSEVDACTDAGAKLEDYAANKLIRQRAQPARTA